MNRTVQDQCPPPLLRFEPGSNMGRPSASPENRAFSVCFAHAISKQTGSRLDFVARSGPWSLFSALARMFPAYARTEDGQGFRDGVSEVQFNKELQKNGFQRVRDRRTCATKRSEDPTGAGMYLFSHLKWRDPNDPEDREALLAKFDELVEKFPLIMLACKLDKFLTIVAHFCKEWSISSEQMGNFVEGEGAESDSSELHQRARRLSGLSPSSALLQQQSAGLHALTGSLFPPSSAAIPPHSFGMVQIPVGAQAMMPMAHHNLNALQSQLTSSLLAVTLAKQQLQGAASLPLSDMHNPLLHSYSAPAISPYPYMLQPAMLPVGAQTVFQVPPGPPQGPPSAGDAASTMLKAAADHQVAVGIN